MAGGLVALGGVAWTFFAIYVVVPHFSGEHSIFFGFYDQVGGSPAGVAKKLVTDPGAVLGALVEGHDIAYWCGSGFRCCFSSYCLRGSQPLRYLSFSRTGSPTSAR